MKNKGYVFLGIFALIIFFVLCHSCYRKTKEIVREYDASMEEAKSAKGKNKIQKSLINQRGKKPHALSEQTGGMP